MGTKGKAFGHRNKNTPKGDLHQTHYSLTWQLLEREKFGGKILEPACGKNAIVNVLKKQKYEVEYFDKYYG